MNTPPSKIGPWEYDGLHETWSRIEDGRRVWYDKKPDELTCSRKGWRNFECPECGHAFRLPTRDRHSPSGEDCPKCHEGWCSPQSSEEDENLKTDAMGNLRLDIHQ